MFSIIHGVPQGPVLDQLLFFTVPGTSGQQILLSYGIYFHYYAAAEFYIPFVTGNGSDLARLKACLAAVQSRLSANFCY